MKRLFQFLLIFGASVLLCNSANAQKIAAKIEVLPDTAKVRVEVKIPQPATKWKFPEFYANSTNLSARIENLKFSDGSKREIVFQKTGAGEFATASAASDLSYEMKIAFPAKVAEAAHVSSLEKSRGVLMLNDLLPEMANATAAKIEFVLPAGWKIAASETQTSANQFETKDFAKSVFLVGDFTEQILAVERGEIRLARTGADWSFSEAEMLETAANILAEHRKTFGVMPADKIQILLLPFPQKFAGENWEAETRGSTLVLFAAQIPFKSRAVSRLQEQLRHELFHLWLPNALNLRGDYAWFYEGFTIYQALKTGVRLKQIRFADFLDTLSRAFDAAQRSPQNKTVRLIDASKIRFSTDNSEFVYAKGIIVAFLYDLTLLQKSKSLDDVFKELLKRHRPPNKPPNANEAVLSLLKSSPETRSIIEKYVETAGEIEWAETLAASGLQNAARTSLTRLAVAEKLNKRQRKLLEKLGFADSNIL